MKKILAFVLALSLVLTLCGCGSPSNKSSTSTSKSTVADTQSSQQSSYDYSDSSEADVDVSDIKPIDYFWFAYCMVDDYMTGESDSIDLIKVYQLIEVGFQKYYAATEIDASDSWQVQERKLDLQDAIEPATSALGELEEYLMGGADSVDLIKVHDGLAQGLLNYQDIS